MPVYSYKGSLIGFEMKDGTFICYRCRKNPNFDLKKISRAVSSFEDDDSEAENAVAVCDICGKYVE